MSQALNLELNALSPFTEAAAYETLWAMNGMSETKLAALFKGGATPSEALASLVRGDDVADLKAKVEEFLLARKGQFSICVHGDFQYPERLRSAKYPVEILYYKGDLSLVEQPALSIVGSRKCSDEGKRRTRKIATLLAKKGYTIVSGLAAGIDTEALRAAMEAGGRVVGVIGTPIDQYYPKENRDLQDEIAKNHLLVSHVPFYRYKQEAFREHRLHFPRRNATMSALSEGTIIVEAAETSGTLTQARAAIQQGRKLFILNSCFEKQGLKWPHTYEGRGAIRVRELADIVKHLGA